MSEYDSGPMDIQDLVAGATTRFWDSGEFRDYGNYTQRRICAHPDCERIITNRARYCSHCMKLATVRRAMVQMAEFRAMLGIEEDASDD